jgi:hypothetical protein
VQGTIEHEEVPLSGTPKLDELHGLIGDLRRCVTSLQTQYHDIVPMRRIANDADRLLNDLDRLDIDTGQLDVERAAPHPYVGEKIPVPDTQYDLNFWRDVDDEGIGGHLRSG